MSKRFIATALAAVAMGTSFWHPVYLFTLGVLMATSTSVAHLYGAGQPAEIGRLARQALWLSVFLGILSFLTLRHMTWISDGLAVSPDIIPLTQDYLEALSWGVLPIFAYLILRFLSEGIGFTKPIMLIGFLGLIVNVAGNYVLIYGKLGFPALGAMGCGLATSLAMWAMLFGGIVLVIRHPRFRSCTPFTQFEMPRWRQLKPLLRLGLPIGMTIFAESSIFAAVALILGVFGATVVAGHQIALNVAAMTFMLPLSVAMGITIRVGQAMGRNEPGSARMIGFTGIAMAAFVMLIAAILILALARPIAGMYSNDEDVIAIAARMLFFAALFQISDGLQVSANGALRGLKDTRTPMLITIVAYWVIGLPVGYSLAIIQKMGAPGAWIGLIAGLCVAAILLNVRFYRVSRRPR